MTVERVDAWRVVCDGCGEVYTFGEFEIWMSDGDAWDTAAGDDWTLGDAGKTYCATCTYKREMG